MEQHLLCVHATYYTMKVGYNVLADKCLSPAHTNLAMATEQSDTSQVYGIVAPNQLGLRMPTACASHHPMRCIQSFQEMVLGASMAWMSIRSMVDHYPS